LRKAGKAKLVAMSSVVTKNGQEATVKAVQEVLYPTEPRMLRTSIDFRQISQCKTRQTIIPETCEMREVGTIIQIVPDVSPDGKLINLTMAPQWLTLDRWEVFQADVGGRKTLPFRQPVFGVTSFSISAQVTCGETILLGSGTTPDGKWIHVGFITARLKEVQP